jgi:hypothetical protein
MPDRLLLASKLYSIVSESFASDRICSEIATTIKVNEPVRLRCSNISGRSEPMARLGGDAQR